MKLPIIYIATLITCLGLAAYTRKSFTTTPCWCWSADQHMVARPHVAGNEFASYGSYGSEPDWSNPEHLLELNYQQEQGKGLYYQQCVWCHADATPAGPSNRSNVTPTPPLMNDGAVFNGESDAKLRQIINLGGLAVGKSAMMPPYGKSLAPDEIDALIAYMRVIAVPAYPGKSSKVHRIWGTKPS